MKKSLLIILSIFIFCACGGEPSINEAPLRAVKTITIEEIDKYNSRQISGTVKSSKQSSLSFRVGGRVTEVHVRNGDKVAKGQILARIDQKEYRLEVQANQAKLTSARSDYIEKSETLKRLTALRKKELVALATYDEAQAAYISAKSNVDVAESALEIAQNNLANTVLKSPFNGTIASRSIDPFIEVTAGTSVFELQSEDALKVEVLMPETLMREVSHGDTVSVQFPTIKNLILHGIVMEVGAKAESGNAFPVGIELSQTPQEIRAGMTAQVIFNFGEASEIPVYLLPVSALDVRVPFEDEKTGKDQVPVFVLDNGIAEKRIITVRDIRGNEFEVVKGLTPGDEVIVAGVSYLSDGQKVKRWQPSYNTPATINQ